MTAEGIIFKDGLAYVATDEDSDGGYHLDPIVTQSVLAGAGDGGSFTTISGCQVGAVSIGTLTIWQNPWGNDLNISFAVASVSTAPTSDLHISILGDEDEIGSITIPAGETHSVPPGITSALTVGFGERISIAVAGGADGATDLAVSLLVSGFGGTEEE